jgi:hypothetical protein
MSNFHAVLGGAKKGAGYFLLKKGEKGAGYFLFVKNGQAAFYKIYFLILYLLILLSSV